MYKTAIITMSDKGAAGRRKDESGPAARMIIEGQGEFEVTEMVILPDEPEILKRELIRLSDRERHDPDIDHRRNGALTERFYA